MGFDTHPHRNMEIISIPMEGDLEHKDSMGNTAVIKSGDIQVLSAGTGITHSEYNKNKDKEVKFLQIWVFPNQKNVSPRYDQITLHVADRKNKFQQVVSPNSKDSGVWVHQDAWFNMRPASRLGPVCPLTSFVLGPASRKRRVEPPERRGRSGPRQPGWRRSYSSTTSSCSFPRRRIRSRSRSFRHPRSPSF